MLGGHRIAQGLTPGSSPLDLLAGSADAVTELGNMPHTTATTGNRLRAQASSATQILSALGTRGGAIELGGARLSQRTDRIGTAETLAGLGGGISGKALTFPALILAACPGYVVDAVNAMGITARLVSRIAAALTGRSSHSSASSFTGIASGYL